MINNLIINVESHHDSVQLPSNNMDPRNQQIIHNVNLLSILEVVKFIPCATDNKSLEQVHIAQDEIIQDLQLSGMVDDYNLDEITTYIDYELYSVLNTCIHVIGINASSYRITHYHNPNVIVQKYAGYNSSKY